MPDGIVGESLNRGSTLREHDVADKKMINIRLNPELWNRAKAAAGERGMTLERWVTDAIEQHIALQRGDGTAGSANGVPAGGGNEVSELAWRVSALEQAVDFLASHLGGGFPGSAEPAAASTKSDERTA
jgi:hypothetical protein